MCHREAKHCSIRCTNIHCQDDTKCILYAEDKYFGLCSKLQLLKSCGIMRRSSCLNLGQKKMIHGVAEKNLKMGIVQEQRRRRIITPLLF